MKTKDKSSSVVPDFSDYTRINSMLLRCMGMIVRTAGNKKDRRSRLLERIPAAIANILCILDLIFQIQWMCDICKTDQKLVLHIATNAISNTTCISRVLTFSRGIRLAYCREKLQMVFESLASVWRKRLPHHEIGKEIIRGAQRTHLFSKCYLSMLCVLSLCFGLPPLKNFLLQFADQASTNHTYDYSQRIFLVRYPFEVNSLTVFNAVYLEEMGILYFVSIFWMSFDNVFVQLTSHTTLQLKLLHYDIETAGDHKDDTDHFKRNIIDIIKRHRELLSIFDMIEDIYSPVIFIIMLVTAMHMCVNLFELSEMLSEDEFEYAYLIHHVFHLIGVIVQLLLYCVFADKLTEQAASIADAAYNCNWTDKNHKHRIYFTILIMKSQRPLHCTAYGFFPIDHKRITSIFNTAMSYYMLIHQTTG